MNWSKEFGLDTRQTDLDDLEVPLIKTISVVILGRAAVGRIWGLLGSVGIDVNINVGICQN